MSGAARAWGAAALVAAVGLGVLSAPPVAVAAPDPAPPSKVDTTLGGGLGRLVAQPRGAAQRRAGGLRVPDLSVRDDGGRVLVDLTPAAGVDRTAFRRAAETAGLSVRAVDPAVGTLEGFVALDRVAALKALPGRGTLVGAVRPLAHVGAATAQGVALQRVDRVQRRGVDGAGVTVGALSDSYDTATLTDDGEPLRVRAAQDVASGDLPGAGNAAHPSPVAVLEDYAQPDAVDEGRAMLQVVHDVAPAARLCFATAFTGQVGFAENVRRLADPAGGCGADVLVDDVSYLDEPFFSEGPISDAVDDVAADGVHHLTAAGNFGVDQAWTSRVKLVGTARALRDSNLKLDGVDPALYSGGFQDLRNGPGVDVAADVLLGEQGGLASVQWDDPVDPDGATYGDAWFAAEGTITREVPEVAFTFTPTADQLGRQVQFRTDGIPTTTSDLVLTVTAPDGSLLGRVDTGGSPEVLAATLDQPGAYTITVAGFDDEVGDFTVDVRPLVSTSAVTTDVNVLVFDPEGNFLAAFAEQNTFTGRPMEIVPLAGVPQVQLVITRSGTGRPGATRLRALFGGGMVLAEHADPLAPAAFGHEVARGATSVAAHSPFLTRGPEAFTSPGGRLRVPFDSAGRRLPAAEQRRQVPSLASTDGGNTTFFTTDSPLDADALPNFFGTSAAAPYAAGVAALALQRARARGQDPSPAALRSRLQRSAFAHDLDPMRARASVDKVTLTARGGRSPEGALAPGSMTDPSFFTLRNGGRRTIRSVTLDGRTASPPATVAGGPAGVVFDPRPYDPAADRRDVGFPFTVGGTGGGLKASTVKVSWSRPNGTGQFARMTLTFRKGLKKGQSLRFGVDRDLADAGTGVAAEGNGADELGGTVLVPSGTKDRSGLTVSVRRTSGRTTVGTMRNALGAGWSPVDGYGLVDAEEAVLGR